MRLVRFVSCIAIFLLTAGRALAQKGPAPFPPPKNLWIVACVNGGTPKSKKSFQPLVRLLRAAYAIPAADTNSLFVFLPDLTGLIREKADGPEADLSAIPLLASVTDDTLAASLAAQYSGATSARLNRKLGIIYPHLLVKSLFTAYTDQAYPPFTFDTVRTLVFSSQNNLYFESSRENARTIEQNKKDFQKRLGDWYSILDNEDEDCYLRKTLTRRTGDLYVKISQLIATDIPGQLDAADFTRFIKSKTTITHYRDSVHVAIRFGKFFGHIPITDMQYAYTNRGSKTFARAADTIRFDGDYAVPDSIRMNVAFLINDPLLGKKGIHRPYTLAFPPKADLVDAIIIYRWLWLTGVVLLIGLILFLIWFIRRQKELRMYKTGFYGLFKDITENEQQLPNKIQLFLFRFPGAETEYMVLQPGHRKAAVQAFLFNEKNLVITAKEKIYKQSPCLVSEEAPAAITVQVLRTSIWKLARLNKSKSPVNWMEAINGAPASSFTIDCSKVRMDLLLTTGAKKPAGCLYFSRSRPFPQLPDYYHYKTEAVVVATEAINEWIEKSGSYPVGPCHIIAALPGQKLGLLYVHFLESATVQIELFDLLHTDQTPETALEGLLEGFLAHNDRCPVLLAGTGHSTGIAFPFPPHKDRIKQVLSAFKELPAILNKPGPDQKGEPAPYPGVFSFLKPDKAHVAAPVFTWEAANYPLKVALVKKTGFKGKTWTIATRPLPLAPEGTLMAKLVMRKGIAYSLYLSPSIHPLYLRQINPVERFGFPKKILVTIELDLPGRQLLINEKSYDIRL